MGKIIILNGSNGVGKTTFARLCKKYHYLTFNISTVTPIKRALQEVYVDIEKKDEKTRKLMSDFKDLIMEYNHASHIFIDIEKKKLDNLACEYILFIDSREPYDISHLEEKYGAKSLLIKNDRIKQVTSNHADKNVYNHNYNYVIHNDGDLESLSEVAKRFVEMILTEEKEGS